jgi:hypothetical protein
MEMAGHSFNVRSIQRFPPIAFGFAVSVGYLVPEDVSVGGPSSCEAGRNTLLGTHTQRSLPQAVSLSFCLTVVGHRGNA